MKLKFLTAAAAVALTTIAFSASAQKNYNEGMATFEASANGQQTEAKVYFKGDSSATVTQQGPAAIKIVGYKKDYLAILVDVPVANIKKAAVATPAELEEALAALPTLTFETTAETKQISGFNCKKVVAKDTKNNKSYDIWITSEISAPSSAFSSLLAKVGGFPVQFTLPQMGREVSSTLKTINDSKVPAGTFGIPAGYDRITLTDLRSMGGGR